MNNPPLDKQVFFLKADSTYVVHYRMFEKI